MKYVEQVLQPGETVAYATSLHWLVYLRPIVLLVLSVLSLIAASAVTALSPGRRRSPINRWASLPSACSPTS